MKKITVIGSPLTLRGGIVKLTEEQALRRSHRLKPRLNSKGEQVKGCYEITGETCFKIGEDLGYEGDVGAFNPEMAAQLQADGKDKVIAELREKIKEMENRKAGGRGRDK